MNPLGFTRFGLRGFESLMQYRIREVLLVSSFYDAFIMQEDGQVLEPIRSGYRDLGLRDVPRVSRAASSGEALDFLDEGDFDLILLTPQLGETDPLALADVVKERNAAIPVVLVGYDSTSLQSLLAGRDRSPFDFVLLWSGDSKILATTIKLLEDRVNARHDTAKVGVQVVLLIEDSIRFLSTYLNALYSQIHFQTRHVLRESVNLAHQLLRMKARPKVLLAQNYEDATRIYQEYRPNLLGVISDGAFPMRAGEEPHYNAGIRFLEEVRHNHPSLPILLQSSNRELAEPAGQLGATFIHKDSPRLLAHIEEFMRDYFGFGPFVFKRPDGSTEAIARNIRELEDAIPQVSYESLTSHAMRNHFSIWLRARTEFALANLLQPKQVRDFPDEKSLRKYLTLHLHKARVDSQRGVIADFDRKIFDNSITFSRIGDGSLGGKARGLAFANHLLSYQDPVADISGVEIVVPAVVVITTELFDQFLEINDLDPLEFDSHDDVWLYRTFRKARLPVSLKEDLREIQKVFCGPLAVRSSSLLEDSHLQPFAGVYETRMVANNHALEDMRLEELCTAVKTVYASTFSSRAMAYRRSTPYHHEEEKMAVVIQEVFGRHRDEGRFYPTFSGVARSHNYYPHGPVKPDDGVVSVALGMGRLVVEGGGLRFSPRHPLSIPHFSSVEDMLQNAQRNFFALNLDLLEDPETESWALPKPYPIKKAEEDGPLALLCSTYSPENETISDGMARRGYRMVSFAGVLKHGTFPLADVTEALLKEARSGLGTAVEMEFAVDMEVATGQPKQLAILQIRPVVVSQEEVRVNWQDVPKERVLAASDRALGNGHIRNIRHILMVDPDAFDRSKSQQTVGSISELDAHLRRAGHPYLLLGPGRWGSGDPWLGIPVNWTHISGAKVVIETGFPDFPVTPSEGSHFFSNMVSFQVGYLTINPHHDEGMIDLDWLRRQPALSQRPNGVRLLELESELEVQLDGRRTQGVVLHDNSA
ncbi:MAG: histidine kinase [Planctomycetota bacterium]|nr:MAG: histidine kinase [Planctomycetota bacterium]